MTRKGRRLTYLTISLGVLVLLIAGYAFKDRAVEQWYLWKLESEDEQSRYDAVMKLAEMGAVGAVPAVLKILGTPSVEKYPSSTGLSPVDMLFFDLLKLKSFAGKRSVPYLVMALDDKGRVPYLSALLLRRLGPQARGAIPALTTALHHESELVRHAAADALKKIQGE